MRDDSSRQGCARPIIGCVALVVLAGLLVAAIALVAARRASQKEAPVGSAGDPVRGRTLTSRYGCASCHQIPGVRSSGATGPPLKGFASRSYIAGRFRNEPIALEEWLRDPQGMKPGTAMPGMSMSERDARDIAAYLEKLK